MTAELPSAADVRAAARRLRGVVHRTPLLTSRALDERAGAQVFVKCENLQRTGSFKFRGAYNRIAQLGERECAAGVVAFSSGNHAQGVALAARLLGVKAAIVMPSDAPASKLAATRGYGAEVVLYDRASQDREAIARTLVEERGATLVPPFDDAHVIAGQGTLGLEMLEDVTLDAIAGPVGGGGMLSGVALAAHGAGAGIELYGVEPETGDDVRQSLARGERVKIAVPQTIADGLQTQQPGVLTFAILREHARAIVMVTDHELRDAMRFAFERMKLVIEPSGAAALAAVLGRKLPLPHDASQPQRIGIVITGGNVDAEQYAAFLA